MQPFFPADSLLPLLVFLTGLCFGSFATMASHRLPRDEEIVTTPSHCPRCDHRLGWRDLFPVFSWLASAGKCRYCAAEVSFRYPAIELLCGLLWLGLFLQHGPSLVFLTLALFATALLILLVADLETGLIPDQLHFVLFPLGLLYHWLLGGDWTDVLAATLTAGFIGLALHYGYFWLRGRHGLGFGDVKFLPSAGLWLGSLNLLVVYLFYAGLLGVVFGLFWRVVIKEERFPFGPALVVALFALVAAPQPAAWFWQGIGSFMHKLMA